jgi:hypothetical protein
MRKKLHALTARAAFVSLTSMSTASFAADNSAAWSALAVSTTGGEQSTCSAHRDGYKDPCGFFGGWIPLGVIVAAAILAIILASSKHNGRGSGFSPPPRPISPN